MPMTHDFKETPLGPLPVAWGCNELGDHAFVTKLAGFEYTIHFDYKNSGPIVAIRGLNIKHGTLDLREIHTIPKSTSDQLPRSKLSKGDLVMSYVGTLGRVAVIPKDEQFHLAPNVAKISVQESAYVPDFLCHFLNGPQGQRIIIEAAASTTQAALSMGNLRRLLIPRPAKQEQRAIATALSDVDALIAGLERLIAKKRDIKQAAMQQLLTGQTRLPGFSGEWRECSLGQIAHIKTGSRNNEDKVEDGSYPFFVRSANVERINTYSHECEAILVPGEGQIGSIFHYINGRFDVHQRVYAITQFGDDISGRFVHLFMSQHFGAWAMQNTVKATVDSLRLPTFQTFMLRLPATLDEQTAIATVLTDMDADLTALESRHAKTRAIKQGMMQELLTGRTRLLEAK